MNQKTGICIVLCLAFLLLFGIWYQQRDISQNQDTQNQQVKETQISMPTAGSPVPAPVSYRYIVRSDNNRLVVFKQDGATVYMQTGIRTENLTQKLQKQAQTGIGFSTQESLFEFLESYSS